MPREKDPFWKHVTSVNHSKWKCNFCGEEYAGGATRIKAHLAGIGHRGIKGCERVPGDVKAEVGKKVKDSSDGGVSEQRIQGNVIAAPTSTSHPPNVEGGNNLQSPQGMPPLQPPRPGRMEEMPQEEGDLALDGATSYYIGSPLPNSLSPDELTTIFNEYLDRETLFAQQNPDTDLSNIATTNTTQDSSQPLQSDNQRVCDSDLSSRRAPMDIEPPIPSQPFKGPPIVEPLNSPLQISSDIINTMGPSTLEGMPEGAPAGASSVQYGQTAVQHSNELLPTCNEERETETSSFPLRESMDGRSQTAKQVDLLFVEGEANMAGPSSSQELDMNEGAPMTSHPYTSNILEENRALKRKLEVLTGIAANIRDEIEFGESLSLKKVRMQVTNWLTGVGKLRNDYTEATREDCLPQHQLVDLLMREEEDLRRQGKGLFEPRETKASTLLEGKMVGEAFQRNTTEILKYLVENQISRLGIYGMGGVGKTTIMTHIHNRLKKANYGKVLWITVSQDFNTKSLQDDIWDALKRCKEEEKDVRQQAPWDALNRCKLEEKDVRKRAAMLSDCLIEKGKSTIIFDDVWAPFDLKEVGIPIREDGIKLILTTRSLDVCRQMHCQEKIKIEPLSQIEAENLFLEELGSDVAHNLETQEIVKSIVKECAGLPLAVITMARSMQGVTNLFEWKDTLEKLRESDMGQTDMAEKVLMNLRFSYDRLSNPQVQHCFLSCALYPEDQLIEKFELIEFFLDQGLIGGLDTREKQYDRGLTILTKLENVCLLEAHRNGMKMHDLIRDMALHIMGATSVVKAGNGLTEIPLGEYWTDALEKVSLMGNDIGEFPLDMSPNCPKLSTLLLNHSLGRVSVIPDSFFKKLWRLEVLNLSWCGLTEIPNSISDLVNLRALLLRWCGKLRHIPCIGKLTSLRKLDARCCTSLEEIKGLEALVNLRYLDLWGTCIKRLPKGTLGGLLKLQYLSFRARNEEDITKLVALEALQCYCGYADDFNKCVRVVGQSNARRYDLITDSYKSLFRAGVLCRAPFFYIGRSVVIDGWSHAIVSVGRECAGKFILIPQDVQKLEISNWDGATNLAGLGPLKCLEELKIERGKNLRALWGGQDEEVIDIHDSPATTPTLLLFPSLRVLEIYGCPELKYLFGYGSKFSLPHLRKIDIRNCEEMVGIMATVTSSPPCHNPTFPGLEKIIVWKCFKMKRVVESEWLPHFPNLRKIRVGYCANMEEIIGGPLPNMTVEEIPLESLGVYCCDKMRMLLRHEWLIHLRHLQEIYCEGCKEMVEMISGAGQSQEGSLISEAGRCQEGSIMTPITNTSFRSSISLPKLKELFLYYLPRLKSICEVSVTCDSIEELWVNECPELKVIPLQLRLRDIKDLPYIWVEDEEKWKTLMWDHPDAQTILQPYLRKAEKPGFPTTIELSVE